jgi:hypothetical protein
MVRKIVCIHLNTMCLQIQMSWKFHKNIIRHIYWCLI